MEIRSSSIKLTAASVSSSFSSHSSILTQSRASNEKSKSAESSPSWSPTSMTRCEGLDLLAMAVHYVAGYTVGIPFVQKRVIRRRKRAIKFNNLVVNGIMSTGGGKEGKRGVLNSKPKRQKRVMAVPLKYQDSVLQPWKRQSRRSGESGEGSGQ